MLAPLVLGFTFTERITIPRSRTRTCYKRSTQRNDKRKIQSQFFVSLRMKSDDSKSSIPSSVSLSESTLTTTTTTPTNSTTTTVSMTLQNAITTLEQNNVSEPIMSTVHLLAMALQLPWETGYYHLLQIVNYHNNNNTNNENINPHESLSNRILTTEELDDFNILLQRRIHHEPIQYICGQWDFCDNIIKIRQPLLCPRPETEELVVYAIQDIKTILKEKITRQGNNDNDELIRVLDIGCGTGCIGITIAKQIPETYVTAIDIEPIAIVTSNENAHRLQVQNQYQVHLCNIENFETEFIQAQHQLHDTNDETKATLLYDMVVSNPPYILPSDMSTLELSVYNYESHAALNGGDSDGMKVIRTIIRTLPNICNVNAICWLEVDPSQPTLMKEFCIEQQQRYLEQKQQQPYHNAKPYDDDDIKNANTKVVQYVECIKDIFGLDRFVKLRIVEL